MTEKDKKDQSKVFKIEEFGDDSFLSGLGFATTPKVEEKEPEKEDIFDIPPKEEKTQEKEVIKKEPPKEFLRENTHRNERPVQRPAQSNSNAQRPAFQNQGFKKRPSFGARPNFETKPKKIDKEVARNLKEVQKEEGITLQPTKKDVRIVPKKEYAPQVSSTLIKKIDIKIGDSITVKEFSEKMGIPLPEVMKKLLMNKIIVSANSSIDYETAALIGVELGVEVSKDNASVSLEDIISGNLGAILAQDKEYPNLATRPPIVTIMGHVDHGKTKLLDYIRKSDVVGGEAGGITQSIGASQILHNGKKITFVDTPGHELFTSLRARGSKITDIVIIAIAADEGVKPQTIEAISHAKDSGVPIIVAATKIDKPNTNLDMIKSQMAEQGLTPEEWGGDVPIVPLSAISGQGVNDLLDLISLQAEMLELKYNPDRSGVGVVLEANKDIKKGVLTSMIIMTGSLKVGDIVFVHNTFGKVRRMIDWKGHDLKVANGGDPVMILGIQDVPEPGRVAEVLKSEKDANIKINLVKEKEKTGNKAGGLQNLLDKISKGENTSLKLIIKADSFGSLEAFKYSISKIDLPENIDIKMIHSELGDVSDSDILLADASDAVVIGFNVGYNANIKKKAEHLKVALKTFDIIYEIVDYIEKLAKGLVKIEQKETYLGKLQILGVFFKKGSEMIIGGSVIDGKAVNGSSFRIHRGEEMIGNGRVTSLRKGDENVSDIGQGHQCGLRIKSSKRVEENDILEFYVLE